MNSIIQSVDSIFNNVQKNLDFLTPRELSQALVELSVYLGNMGDMLSDVDQKYSKIWLQMREKTKSDRHAEIAARTTQTYKTKKTLKLKIEATKELINSLKKRIEVLNNESKNQY